MATPARTDTTQAWTVEDVVRTETAEEWTVSRDGRRAAWVKGTVEAVDGEDRRVTRLWLTELAGEPRSRELTRTFARDSAPVFSPDGSHLAFLSDRPLPGRSEGAGGAGDDDGPSTQAWVLPLAGGEAFPATRFDQPIRACEWIDDRSLAVLAQEARSAYALGVRAGKETTVVVEDPVHEPPVRLYRVGLEGDLERLTTNPDWLDSLAVSPDGRWAVVSAQVDLAFEFDSRTAPETRLIDLRSGASEVVLATAPDERRFVPAWIRWAPDASGFYFRDDHSTHPLYRSAMVRRLWFFDLARRAAREVELDCPAGMSFDYRPLADGVVVLLADGLYDQVARYVRDGDGWRRLDLAWDQARGEPLHAAHLEALAAGPDPDGGADAVLLYQYSTATTPWQWFAARLAGDQVTRVRQVTDLNSDFAGKPTGRAEPRRWTGGGGDEVEGLLLYPLDWNDDGPNELRPLLLDIHGGPAARDRDSWDQRWSGPSLLYRQRGAFVLQVNYHGSTGYGLEFVESIAGRYYELEIPDLENGVDRLIDEGLADPERLAANGWSNGGILTAELITRSRRYRAASIGAADIEWISDWGNVMFGATFDNFYLGGPPWENPQHYIDKSPFFRLTEVTTPTLVFTGTEDTNVPPHQSWSLFRALQHLGKADVRLVLFKGEAHGLKKIAHQRRKIREDLAWFDRYLFAREPAAAVTPALKPGTPLAALFQRAAAARSVSGALGEDAGGAPIPETVLFAGLEVGRFEVTRAQYAAFDRAAFPEGEAGVLEPELPATAVGFERARAYAGWLAARTGRPFRLPTVAEARRLAATARRLAPLPAGAGVTPTAGSGNTLERWAGYSPNPEDAAALHRALAALAERAPDGASKRRAPAPLLLPVGSSPGAGDDPVFDLDGNAAEWVVGEDGQGVPFGPSADRPLGPRGEIGPPASEYVGFRVVVDTTTEEE